MNRESSFSLEGPLVKRLWPYLLLLLLLVAFFWDSFFAHKVLCMRDPSYALLNAPQFASKALKTNEFFPLWNPFIAYGKPYLAEPESGFFYPVNWFFYLFSVSRGLVASYTCSVFIAGASVYALARHWKLDIFPALLSSVCLMFSTWLIAMLEFRALCSSFVWGPLELLLVSNLIEKWRDPKTAGIRKNFWPIVALAATVSLQYLAGYPQVLLYNQLLVGCFLAARCLWLGNRKMLTGLAATLTLAGCITAALIMVQFLPSWDFIQYTDRGLAVDPGLDMASFHPRGLLTLLFPYLDGRPGYPQEYWGQTIFEFWLGTCYIGILPLILITFSPFCLKRFTGKDGGNELHRFLFVFFCGIAGLGLLMAAGKYTPLYMFAYKTIPGFSHFRWPSKFLFFVLYSLCILSGLGCQQLLNWKKQNKPPKAVEALMFVWCFLLLLIVVGCLFATDGMGLFALLTGDGFISTPIHLQETLHDYERAAIFLLAGLLVVFAVFSKRVTQTASGFLIVGVTFVNLWFVSREIQPIMDDDIYELVPKTIGSPFRRMQPDRVYSLNAYSGQYFYGCRERGIYQWAKDAATNNILQASGIFQAHQIGLILQRHGELYGVLPRLAPRERDRLADIMNIRYIVNSQKMENVFWGDASKEVQVIERSSFLPHAYVVESYRIAHDLQTAAQTMLAESFDPRREVVIEPLEGAPLPQCSPDCSGKASAQASEVKSLDYQWNSVDLNVSAARESLLVLTDTWFPGWKATVNGNPAPIYQANALFRAVPVQPGMNRVHFEYRPRPFFVGLAISLTTVLLLCGVAVGGWVMRRSR